jgi:hypothetical protein
LRAPEIAPFLLYLFFQEEAFSLKGRGIKGEGIIGEVVSLAMTNP